MTTEPSQVEKPKLTAVERAAKSGESIYKSGFSAGKAEGRKESTNPDAKRLGILVNGAVKMKEKGKTVKVKNLRDAANNITDENDYPAIENLVRKSLLMLANGTKPAKKPKETPEPSTA